MANYILFKTKYLKLLHKWEATATLTPPPPLFFLGYILCGIMNKSLVMGIYFLPAPVTNENYIMDP